MNFKDKLLEQLNREDLADNEARVNAIIESVGEFIPKGTYNNLSQRLKNVENEKNVFQIQLDNLKKESMSLEEQNAQKIADILQKAEERERKASIRENSAEAREILINAGLSKEELDNSELFSNIVTENRENTISRANALANLFKSQKAKVEEQVKNTFYNSNPVPPASDKQDNVVTKDQLAKMTYSEELEFANQNPTLYAELTK